MKRVVSIVLIVGSLAGIGMSCGATNKYGMARPKKSVKIVKKVKKGCGCTGKRK